MLAEAQAAGDLRIRPLEITTGGEQLKPHQRSLIESVFGVRIRNNYACTEAIYLALSQADDEGLYLQEDEVHFEIHPRHVCITPLFNFTFPLIRYRLDDALTLAPRADSQLPFQRVQSVVGRQDWSLEFQANGGRRSVLTFPTLDRLSLPGVAALQAVQESDSSFSLRVKFNNSLVAPERRQLQERLEGMLRDTMQTMRLDGVHYRLCEASELYMTSTGKVRHMVPCAKGQQI
jgi:phenylacetate-CoA ligase